MTKQLTAQEFEILSAYLDGELTSQEQSRLEQSLEQRSEMRQALDELRRTRIILRSATRLRAPRNFTLTAEMVGSVKPARKPLFAVNALRFSSALASILFVLTIIGEWFTFSGPLAAPVAMVSEPASQAESVPPEAAMLAAPTSAPAELRQMATPEPSAKGFETTPEAPLPTAEISMFAQPAEETTAEAPSALEAPLMGSALVAETPTPEPMAVEETPAEMPADQAPNLAETEEAIALQPAPPLSDTQMIPTDTPEAMAIRPVEADRTMDPHLPWRFAQGLMLILALATAAGAIIVRQFTR